MLCRKINHGITSRQWLQQSLRLGYIAELIELREMFALFLVYDRQRQIVTCTQALNQTRSNKTGTPDDSYFTLIHNLSLSQVFH
ncbi:hypothetical protein D3C85_1746880 [compost metagenome]